MDENNKINLTQIEDILCELNLIQNKGHLDYKTGLIGNGVGLDSVEILQLVSSIEETFEITIEDKDLLPEHFVTVGSFITFVEKYL